MTTVKIFVDFWNFQLGVVENFGDTFRIDWELLPTFLIDETSKIVKTTLNYNGTNIYLSYNENDPKDDKFKRWVNNWLSRVPGYTVTLKERRQKNHPVCQVCHNEIKTCQNCGATLNRTVEKGIDTAIVTDLLSTAWEKTMDVAILVSSDKDFIPAVNLLQLKGCKIINARFTPQGAELAGACWGNINLITGKNYFGRKAV